MVESSLTKYGLMIIYRTKLQLFGRKVPVLYLIEDFWRRYDIRRSVKSYSVAKGVKFKWPTLYIFDQLTRVLG